ncbi:MAG: M1 family metallopeptidase [Thermoplasmatales archaeon]|nr:M1 family metallopeptidase [Thermoplasmatales archaeon]
MYSLERYELNFDFKFKELKYGCVETLNGKFSGQVELDIENLTVGSVKMNGADVLFSVSNKKLVVGPTEGSELKITFSGAVSETSLMGIHDAKYDGGHIITTQMEPTGARSVFPCFDEPATKAKFKVEVTVDEEVEVIFNTRHLSKEVGNGRAHFVFDETPSMSTYLFYLGIGKFQTISRKNKDRFLYLATSPGKAKEGKFSLNLLSKLFTKYEAYYKIPFPLPKMHLIALPQFGAGAMENWGAITFREIALLVNNSTSFRFKKQVAYVVSHEFAHQWFGDLVTMKWWDDLWLNESFATFVGYKILAKVHKDWNLWEDFQREETLPSMRKDGLLTTHPIRVEVKDPYEISEIFDDISYGKGASILRMTEQFIGEGKYREGIYRYLKGHEYSNASGEDLWSSLTNASRVNVSSLMKSWLEKAGFPLVNVKEEDGELRMSQQKFSYLPNDDAYVWQVPIFLERDGKKRKILLKKKQTKIKSAEKLLINSNGEGYYRLLLEGNLLDRMLTQESSSEFVMKLIDDYYAFLLSGRIDMQQFLGIVDKIKERNEYSIVMRLVEIFSSLAEILDSDGLNKMAVGYFRSKLSSFKDSPDENSKVVLESILTGLALNDKEFRTTEKVKLGEYNSLTAEERTAVLLSASIEEYNKEALWNMLKTPENDMEVIRVMHAMTHLPKNEEVTQFFDFVISKPEYRGNFIYSMFEAISNKNYRKDLWSWTSAHLNGVREIFVGSSTVSRYVEELISRAGIGNRESVGAFLKSTDVPEAARAIKNGLERLEINEKLVQRTPK